MSLFQEAWLSTVPAGYISSMRSLLSSSSLLSFLAYSSAQATSYHENAGNLRYVNPNIGTYGVTPNGNGGMIPSVSPPFGMTRWTPQTRYNMISVREKSRR